MDFLLVTIFDTRHTSAKNFFDTHEEKCVDTSLQFIATLQFISEITEI